MRGWTNVVRGLSRTDGLSNLHGGAPVSQILIECPVSGRLVPTGVNVSHFDELAADNVLLSCPGCGESHVWRPRDAVSDAGETIASPVQSGHWK
jgi:hypothetical protein